MTEPSAGLTPGSTYRSPEAWAWAHEPVEQDSFDGVNAEQVLAVMVVHNGAEWLPRQLVALAGLEPRPGRIVVVDNGSTDGSPDLLHQALDEGVIAELISGDARQGFGAAVNQALEHQDAREWLWLLHDDSTPKRRALGELLRCADKDYADVLVPKLLMPKRRNYPDQLLEVGRSVSFDGRISRNVEPGDIDQRQMDPKRVLGGSTAGMLIRWPVWEELGGFDPDLPLFRDGVEFGWRANARGFRVRSCPQAALYHRQAGFLGYRASELTSRPATADRAAGLKMMAARAKRRKLTILALTLVTIARSIGFLLGKSPGAARDEIAALPALWGNSKTLKRMSQRLDGEPEGDPERMAAVTKSPLDDLRHVFDRAAGGVVERYRDIATDGQMSIDELTGDDFAGGRARQRLSIAPWAVTSLLLLVCGIVATRAVFGGATGLGMLAPPTTLGEAWAAFITPTAGAPGTSPIWLAFMAIGSTLTFGNPSWFSWLILALTPLLAAWAAHSLLRLQVDSAWVRAGFAGAYGVAVMVLGFVRAGSLTGIFLAIGLPMLVRAAWRWRERSSVGAERWRGPAATAGWLVLTAGAYPLVLALALVAGIIWAIRKPGRIWEILVALLAPVIFFLGWVPTLWRYPGRVLTGVDPLANPDFVPNAWLLAGVINPGAPNRVVNLVFFLLLFAAAAWTLRAALQRPIVLMLVGGIGVAYLMAAGLSRLVVGVSGGQARADVSMWLLLVVGLLTIAPALVAEFNEPKVGLVPQVLVNAALALAALWCAYIGVSPLLQPNAASLPAFTYASMDSSRQTRTLVITLNGNRATWAVVDAKQPRWGSAERDPANADFGFSSRLRALAQGFARGQVPENVAAQLTELGVNHVWVKGADADRVAAISNAARLTRAAVDETSHVWSVTGVVSRAGVFSRGELKPLPTEQIEAGSGRTLVVAEPPDSRVWATLNGKRLTRLEGPLATFALPDEAGTLAYGMSSAGWYFALQLLATGFLVVLAAPVAHSPQARRGMD